MHLCLFEDAAVAHLHPLTHTRAAFDLRLGGRTVLETARDTFTPDGLVLHTRPLVAGVTALEHPDALMHALPPGADVLFWNGRAIAHPSASVNEWVQRAGASEADGALYQGDALVAAYVSDASTLPEDLLDGATLDPSAFDALPSETASDVRLLSRLWHLLDGLRDTLTLDIDAAAQMHPASGPLANRPGVSAHPSAIVVKPDAIVTGSDVTIRPGAILNAEAGPIFLGTNAVVHERAVVKGPCYVGPSAQVKVGGDVEGTALGYYSKVGGEVHGTVVHSLSNKGHAGFLGDSYLGRWCNLGADTNTSNLKNDYGSVSLYDPAEDAFVHSGRQFLGLVMGDHSKCGINTMFNTGTVVGVSCNIYDGGFPPRYVPAFSWGSPGAGFTDYRLEKALRVAEAVMARRDVALTDADRRLLATLFQRTAEARATWHDL